MMASYVVRVDGRVWFCPTKLQARSVLLRDSAYCHGCARMWSNFPSVKEGECIKVKPIPVKDDE